MTDKCFEIGTIQAFLDGELGNDSLEQVSRHLSVCGDCARLLAETESESAFAFAALDNELNSVVPTERIRRNLYEAIAAQKKSFWKRIFGENFRLANPSVAAFAGLVLAAGIFTALVVLRENRTAVREIAKAEISESIKPPNFGEQTEAIPAKLNAGIASVISSAAPRIKKAVAKPIVENRAKFENADYKIQKSAIKNQAPKIENNRVNSVEQTPKNNGLLGEESYVKTIATLTDTVNSRKDETLKPSARVAFEKDLAVVDDAIAKMQREVRKDPKNEAAKELLRSSYQNKIELLSSVADKSELMATLR